jgi:hypothetical protein
MLNIIGLLLAPMEKKKDTIKFGRPICNPWGHFVTPKCSKLAPKNPQYIKVISQVTLSFSPPILSAFIPYPLFQWYPQSKEIL